DQHPAMPDSRGPACRHARLRRVLLPPVGRQSGTVGLRPPHDLGGGRAPKRRRRPRPTRPAGGPALPRRDLPQDPRLGRPCAARPPPATGPAAERRPVLVSLDADRLAKIRQILEVERDLARGIVHTPYVLLMVIPGVNVVTVADLAGELGPIAWYRDANAITG